MDFMQESTAGTSRDRAHQIITGKRIEHQSPYSPFGMVDTTSSSYNGSVEGNSTGPAGCILSYYTSGDSPTTMSSEEEEDMANCLIMLAESTVYPTKENKPDLHRQKTEKLKTRRLTEMAATTAGEKSNFHYECKTCNRGFQSFQALGGHRASHKKPKLTAEDQPEVVITEYEENNMITNNHTSPFPPPGFIQTGFKNSNKGKVHECSICGSEFFSGQALGGHMRRHRPAPPSSSQIAVSSKMDNHHSPKKSPVLSLDLNLPAPEVDSNFQYTASSSQQPFVFSATALIDCHY